jgi:hypothetical protein
MLWKLLGYRGPGDDDGDDDGDNADGTTDPWQGEPPP